ncbi:MAG: lytic murein transglycosylase B [Pseudomonadota bacterium]|nr:lytic murein transglycosylase B [Pseudomonadota bacterium]
MRLMRGAMGVFAFLVAVTALGAEPASYRSGAKQFASEMARKHGVDPGEVSALMDQARFRQEIIDKIRRPYESKPWYKYRKIFLTAKRIAGGVEFWRNNEVILDRAREEYGVPPEIIVAIIGVETNYGGNLGKDRVIDALSTLGFAYPPRADFFRKELEQFLLLAQEESVDAIHVQGSYAGAVGMPQFIPSSYRAYAVDFDGDGRRNLWESNADVIGSVANYFKRNGWRTGEPVAFKAEVTGRVPAGLPVAEKKPKKPGIGIEKLKAAGVISSEPLSPSTRVTLIRLESPEDEYWLGLGNFYAITRYNHSNLYAMAVYQLSREIKETYETRGRETAARD